MNSATGEVRPSDLSSLVDARRDGARRAWWVETGERTPRIANETVTAHPVGVRPGDLSPVVIACCEGTARAWYVENGDRALRIANESVTNESAGVILRVDKLPGDYSRVGI